MWVLGEGSKEWWGRELRGWINHGRPSLWLNICVGARVHAKVCVHLEALGPTLIKMQFNQSADGVSRGDWNWTEMSNTPWIADRDRKLGKKWGDFLFILIKRYLFDLFAILVKNTYLNTSQAYLFSWRLFFFFGPLPSPGWESICGHVVQIPSVYLFWTWKMNLFSVSLLFVISDSLRQKMAGSQRWLVSYRAGCVSWPETSKLIRCVTTWMTLCDWPIQCFHSFHPLYGPLIRKMGKLVYSWFTSHN